MDGGLAHKGRARSHSMGNPALHFRQAVAAGPAGWQAPGMDRPAEVTIVTVTWRSAGVIGDFLAACPADLPVIVVDNASPDATVQAARQARPDAHIIENARNLGFGVASNAGLDAVTTEFALLANPDARLTADAIACLVAAARRWPEARLVAPLLADGQGQPVRSWNVAQGRRAALPRGRAAEPWPEGPFCAAFASGACLLLRPASGLRFDPSFFLFYEDDDLCARAGGAVLVPGAVVRHAGGRSSVPDARLAWRKARHMAWSRLRFTALHGGGVAAARRHAAMRLVRHAGKAVGHVLTLRGRKAWADAAGFAGTLAWLAGRR